MVENTSYAEDGVGNGGWHLLSGSSRRPRRRYPVRTEADVLSTFLPELPPHAVLGVGTTYRGHGAAV